MFEKSLFRFGAALVAAALLATTAQAIDIDTVTVGNPGNAGELSGEGAGGYGPDRICGAVDYVYDIAKYEVTNAQYIEFLNAVAATDTHGLYNNLMWGIGRSGVSGSYSYWGKSYGADIEMAEKPVNYVSWGDAARFANWMHNGQPTGSQDLTTTEDGSYFLNGTTSWPVLLGVTREPDATWVIPSEDEWYKAAYYDGSGGYYDYPTQSNTAPTAESPPGGSNSANYAGVFYPGVTSDVGAYTSSDSAYGTFDQGGNVWELNEAIIGDTSVGLRGGSYYYLDSAGKLQARFRNSIPPGEHSHVGFRVASIPEPGSITLFVCGLVSGLIWWRRRT